MMHMIDKDGSGEVTFDEFVNEVAGDEDVWSCFQVTFLALSLLALTAFTVFVLALSLLALTASTVFVLI